MGCISVHEVMLEKNTYRAAISPSLELFPTRCRDRHIFTKLHAATASHAVHISLDIGSFNGSNVVKVESSNGDYTER